MPGSCECLICAPLGPDRESDGIVGSLILMIHMQLQHLSYQLPFSSQTWPFGCTHSTLPQGDHDPHN